MMRLLGALPALGVLLCLAGLMFWVHFLASPAMQPAGPAAGGALAPAPGLLEGSPGNSQMDRAGETSAAETRRPHPPPALQAGEEFHLVFGAVEDGRGARLAGVSVALLAPLVWGLESGLEPLAAGESRADGTWGIRLAEQQAPNRMVVLGRKPGFAAVLLETDRAEGHRTEVPALVLREGGTVEGAVAGPTGRPVAGARVQARTFQGIRGGPPAARTDAAGRFRLEGLALGTELLVVDAEGFLLASRELEIVPSFEPLVLEIRLERGLSLSGRVLAPGRLPAPGASVEALRRGEPAGIGRREATRTDAQGRFELCGLEPGMHELLARAGGLVGRKGGVGAGDQEIDLLLQPAGGVRGIALDPAGAPLAAGWVECRLGSDEPQSGEADRLVLRPADRGRFRFDGLEPGFARIRIEAPGFGPAAKQVQVRAGEAIDLGAIRVKAGAWLEVAVMDALDRPLSGVRLSAFHEEWSGLAFEPGCGRRPGRVVTKSGHLARGMALPAGRTDPEGLCRLAGLAPGLWKVIAEHPEHAPEWVLQALESGAGVRTRLRLTPGGSLAVLVHDRQGRARAEAQVELSGPKRGSLSPDKRIEWTDPQGAARFHRLAPGFYLVRLPRAVQTRAGSARIDSSRPDRNRDAGIHVHEGEAALLKLAVPSLWTLRGIVTGPEGPVEGAVVALGPPGAPSSASGVRTRTGGDGSWLLEEIPAGPVGLRWSRAGAVLESARTLDLAAEGGEWQGALALPTGAIEGLALGPEGRPAARVFLFLGRQEAVGGVSEPAGLARTDAEGRFRVAEVPAGRWLVGPDPRQDGRTVRVDLPEGGTARVEVRL